MRAVDVLIVGLGSTAGLRMAEDELADGLRRAGATVAVVRARPPRDVRTFVLTDLMWARAARAAAQRGLAAHEPRAIVFSTVTSALLWPRSTAGTPRAIRYDAPAAANRPGRHGLWQRPRERRRLRSADLLLPQSQATLVETPEPHAPAVVVGIPVEPSAADALPWAQRDVTAVTYAANWEKKGLDRVLGAWEVARRDGEALVVCGADETTVATAARRAGLEGPPAGVVARALLSPREYRALVRRARVYVTAPRREDHGVAQLEALADGCAVVTTAGAGPSVALPAARSVDPRWVVPEDAGPQALAAALRSALDDPPEGVEARALAAIAPHRQAAIDDVIARDVIPALLPAS